MQATALGLENHSIRARPSQFLECCGAEELMAVFQPTAACDETPEGQSGDSS